MQTKKQLIPQIIMSLVAAIFFISFAVTVTLHFRQLYYRDVDKLDIPGTSGYSKEICIRNYDVLIDYNSFTGPEELIFPDLAMSETGRIHFEEVKNIFLIFEAAAVITGIAFVSGSVYIFRKKKKHSYLLWAGLIDIIIPAALALFIYLNWDRFFVFMHSILFNNDYWIFDETTDPVIKILPDTFFEHAAIMIISIVLILSLISVAAWFIIRHKSKNKALD